MTLIDMLKEQLKGKDNIMSGIVYLPEVGEFLRIEEGSGDNLDYEDEEEGYVDYIYLENYKMFSSEYDFEMVHQDFCIPKGDCGFLMLEDYYVDMYKGKFYQAIVDSIEFTYPNNKITMAFYIPEQTKEDTDKYNKMHKLFNM